MTAYTVGLADAKRDFCKVANEVAESGTPVTVMRHNKPHVMIVPAVHGEYERHAMAAAVDFLEVHREAFEKLS